MLVFLICVVGAPLLETELNTLTNIFECFIRALLLRHIRTHYSSLGVKRLKGLQHLPPQISSQFNLLCKLAYVSISDNKTILDMETIKTVADIDPKSLDTLSVMKEKSICTREGKKLVRERNCLCALSWVGKLSCHNLDTEYAMWEAVQLVCVDWWFFQCLWTHVPPILGILAALTLIWG